MPFPKWPLLGCALACGFTSVGSIAAAPDTPSEAEQLQELVASAKVARVASKGDRGAVDRLATAVKALTKQADALRPAAAQGGTSAKAGAALASAWNDAVTVLRRHGAPAPSYVVRTVTAFTSAGLSLNYPVGDRWSHQYSGNNDQLLLTLTQKSPSGATIAKVELWTYRWDTAYSGVGGENYVKLARVILEGYRADGVKGSDRVTPLALNAKFPRVQYFFLEGYSDAESSAQRRFNYYMKDEQQTYNVELSVNLDRSDDDDETTAWQRTDADPERANLLKTLSSIARERGK